jgi:membrane-bound metal-dependent hydrolase YbcI (DUF457 family)
MPELSLHFAVTFALTAPVLGLRKAGIVSFMSLLPDLDFLFYVHRSISHSIVVLLVGSLIVVSVIRRFKPDLFSLTSAACLGLIGHSIMDVFSGPTPLLWPLTGKSVSISVSLGLVAEESFRFSWTALVKWSQEYSSPIPVTKDAMVGPIFSSEGFAVSFVLVAVLVLLTLLRKRSSFSSGAPCT